MIQGYRELSLGDAELITARAMTAQRQAEICHPGGFPWLLPVPPGQAPALSSHLQTSHAALARQSHPRLRFRKDLERFGAETDVLNGQASEGRRCVPFPGKRSSSSCIFFFAAACLLVLSPAKSQRESIYPNIPDFSQSPSAALLLMYRQMISRDLYHIRPPSLIYLKCIYKL